MTYIHLPTNVYIQQGFSVRRFGLYSPKHMFYGKIALISIKALICGYFEPKNLRARLPKKAAMPL